MPRIIPPPTRHFRESIFTAIGLEIPVEDVTDDHNEKQEDIVSPISLLDPPHLYRTPSWTAGHESAVTLDDEHEYSLSEYSTDLEKEKKKSESSQLPTVSTARTHLIILTIIIIISLVSQRKIKLCYAKPAFCFTDQSSRLPSTLQFCVSLLLDCSTPWSYTDILTSYCNAEIGPDLGSSIRYRLVWICILASATSLATFVRKAVSIS
jgi:hypothetical protein